uniref:Uncharacterized protein n=1 Tax=Salix viminalis TaxID=40686 RepID=A0A6N2LEY8_SALVM
MAFVQHQKGPDVVGPFGLLQPIADGLKLILKETISPSSANLSLFRIAPVATFMLSLVTRAVIPFDYGMGAAIRSPMILGPIGKNGFMPQVLNDLLYTGVGLQGLGLINPLHSSIGPWSPPLSVLLIIPFCHDVLYLHLLELDKYRALLSRVSSVTWTTSEQGPRAALYSLRFPKVKVTSVAKAGKRISKLAEGIAIDALPELKSARAVAFFLGGLFLSSFLTSVAANANFKVFGNGKSFPILRSPLTSLMLLQRLIEKGDPRLSNQFKEMALPLAFFIYEMKASADQTIFTSSNCLLSSKCGIID